LESNTRSEVPDLLNYKVIKLERFPPDSYRD